MGVDEGGQPSLDFKLRRIAREMSNEAAAMRYATQKSNSRSRNVAGMADSEAMLVNLWVARRSGAAIHGGGEVDVPVEGVVNELYCS